MAAQTDEGHERRGHDMPPSKGTKQGGRFTEPELPAHEVFIDGEVIAVPFYRSGDHAPPHLHLIGGGPVVRIGQNGRPIDADSNLTARQAEAVQRCRAVIRKAVRKIGRWHWFNSLGWLDRIHAYNGFGLFNYCAFQSTFAAARGWFNTQRGASAAASRAD